MTTSFSRFLGVAALGMALPSISLANGFDGAYAGGQLGLMTHVTVGIDDSTGLGQLGADSFGPERIELFGGYGLEITPGFYLGGQVGYTVFNNFDEKLVDDAPDNIAVEAGTGFSIKALAGYVPNPSTLLYATVGYQQREFTLVNSFSGSSVKAKENVAGVTFGFGMQQYIGDRLTLTAEVLQTDYSKEGFSVDPLSPAIDFDFNEMTFDIGLAYRF